MDKIKLKLWQADAIIMLMKYADMTPEQKKAHNKKYAAKKKARMASDSAYRDAILKNERERIAAKRLKRPGYVDKENARRRERYQERLDDPEEDFREKENQRYNEWYAKNKAKKPKKKTGSGLDLLKDDIF